MKKKEFMSVEIGERKKNWKFSELTLILVQLGMVVGWTSCLGWVGDRGKSNLLLSFFMA